jgi:hypothetical protein
MVWQEGTARGKGSLMSTYYYVIGCILFLPWALLVLTLVEHLWRRLTDNAA